MRPEMPHGVGVQRVDLQFLLDFGAALLGVHDAIAYWRSGSVPKTLAGILLQGAQGVLGIFLGLILVKQRHDLAHHDVHGVVAQLLRHGDEAHSVLREAADIELQLEMIAKKAAKRVDDHHVKRGRPGRARLHHALELGTAFVCG
jgi:hypothetical protein